MPVTGSDSSRQSQLEPLLSVEEVTAYLRVSESTVHRLTRSGELKRVKLGGRTLFEPEELRRYVASKRVGDRPATRTEPEVQHG